MKEGRVLASGAKRDVLTAEVLSRAFDAEVRLSCRAERYTLEVLVGGPRAGVLIA